MKKIAFLLLLFSGSLYFSQSVVQKYNSLYKRYEFFNSSGNMIGYKEYNNLSKQWEYYESNTKQSQKQPRQYSEYIKPSNLDLMERALIQKQQNYDTNFQTVKSNIDYMINDIKGWDMDSNMKQDIIQQFKNSISKNLDSKDIDYSSKEQYNIVMNWLYNNLEMIIKNVYSKYEYSPRNNGGDLSSYYNEKFTVTRITHYNKNGFIIDGASDLKNPSYIILTEHEIKYRNAKGIDTYRNLINKKINNQKSRYEYSSNWGAVLIYKDLSSVTFHDKNDMSGDYYIFHISN